MLPLGHALHEYLLLCSMSLLPWVVLAWTVQSNMVHIRPHSALRITWSHKEKLVVNRGLVNCGPLSGTVIFLRMYVYLL